MRTLLSLGGFGLLLFLLLTDRLITRNRYDEKEATSETWKATAERERDARVAAEKRAEVAIETAMVCNEILNTLRRRGRSGP